jgi:hypothetical protein
MPVTNPAAPCDCGETPMLKADYTEIEKRILAQYARQCETCPFAGSDAVEQAINLGCVPSVYEIMSLKKDKGLNWGCHSAEPGQKRVCGGFVVACLETGLPLDGKLLPYGDWYHKGVPVLDAYPDDGMTVTGRMRRQA